MRAPCQAAIPGAHPARFPTGRSPALFAGSPVTILEPHDVVLAEVRARLHLDDVQRDLAGILDAVTDADRDVRRLILLEQEDLIAAGDACRAGDDDPVLRAMMMQLQGQRRARLDLQALHLEARAVLDAVVAAPGPEDLAMERVLVAAPLLEPMDELLHVLHAVLRRDEHGVLGLD